MSFDDFIAAAWSDHTDRAEEVAERLKRSLAMVEAAAHVAPYAQLVTHVYGEHLGCFDDGIALLQSLIRLPAWDGSAQVVGVVERGVAVLGYCNSGDSSLPNLSAEDRIAVLATASSALLGRKDLARAIAAYQQALQLSGERPLARSSAAVRTLAVGGNNLAAELEEKAHRSDLETRAMLLAAGAGLKYWKLAGTWLEEERAEYRLARSLLQAGDPREAIQHARRCVEVCEENNAPSFELFFGHATLAVAQRAAGDEPAFVSSRPRALQCYEQVAADEKPWCASDLAELGRAER